jgi:hypothetical protein
MSWIFSLLIIVISYIVGKSIGESAQRRAEPLYLRARINTYWNSKQNLKRSRRSSN